MLDVNGNINISLKWKSPSNKLFLTFICYVIFLHLVFLRKSMPKWRLLSKAYPLVANEYVMVLVIKQTGAKFRLHGEQPQAHIIDIMII